MNVVGTIMEVAMGIQCPKNGGGSYPGTRITYRDESGSLKEQMLHENVLKYNPAIKSALESLKKDDQFTMVKEKEGQHWNVKSIINGMVSAPSTSTNTAATSASTATQAGSSGGFSSPKGTYQTAEERAQVQVYIVRQSTLTQAINFFELTKNTKVTPANVIELAKQLEAHVFGNHYDDGTLEGLESNII